MCSIVFWIPFHPLRKLLVKLTFKRIGHKVILLRNLDIRKPRNIEIGDDVIINKEVLLDGRGGSLKIGSHVDIAQETIIWTLGHDVNGLKYDSWGGELRYVIMCGLEHALQLCQELQ